MPSHLRGGLQPLGRWINRSWLRHLIAGIPNEGSYSLAAWKEALKLSTFPLGSPGSLAAVLEGAGVMSCNIYVIMAGTADVSYQCL